MRNWCVAVLALALDWWLGEPRRWHPLVGFGAYAQALERWLHGPGEAEGGRAASERGRGALAMSLAVLPPVALCAALSRVPMIGTVLIVLVLYAVVGHRSLYEHAHAVQESPQDSLAAMSNREGLVVLRSCGKFFGLPGARVGFALATRSLLTALADRLGPWTVSGPSRFVACRALRDRPWQEGTRARLRSDGARLAGLLKACGLAPTGGCELFQWRLSEQASRIHESLARVGILTRLFECPVSVRFGLPGPEKDWQRLGAALRGLPMAARE